MTTQLTVESAKKLMMAKGSVNLGFLVKDSNGRKESAPIEMTLVQDVEKHFFSQTRARQSGVTTGILTAGEPIAASGRSGIPPRADPLTELLHLDFEVPGSGALNRQACANMVRVSRQETK